MPAKRPTAAEGRAVETEAHERAIHAALAWPMEPCPQPYSAERMSDLSDGEITGFVAAWTFNAYSKRVTLGGFTQPFHTSEGDGSRTLTQTQGGPWFATEAEARLAMRWAVCREMAEALHRLVETEARAIVRETDHAG